MVIPRCWRLKFRPLFIDPDKMAERQLDFVRLVRVSVKYSPEEDRVLMNGLGAQGDRIKLWFTARLLQRVVAHMATVVDLHSIDNRGDADHSDGEAHEGISSESCTNEVLVRTVDVKSSGGRIEQIYKDDQEIERAALTLSQKELALWLRGLEKCFARADWPLSVFDGALDSEVSNGEGSPVTLH